MNQIDWRGGGERVFHIDFQGSRLRPCSTSAIFNTWLQGHISLFWKACRGEEKACRESALMFSCLGLEVTHVSPYISLVRTSPRDPPRWKEPGKCSLAVCPRRGSSPGETPKSFTCFPSVGDTPWPLVVVIKGTRTRENSSDLRTVQCFKGCEVVHSAWWRASFCCWTFAV